MNISQPGQVVQTNGALEFKLQGVDRANAHIRILECLDTSFGIQPTNEERDLKISEIMVKDPSLILSRIPSEFPLPRHNLASTDESWCFLTDIWGAYSERYGNWLTRFLRPNSDFTNTIRVALESGMHPDDESVWPEKRLLGNVEWLTDPKRLAIALSFGASPNRNSGDWKDSYLRTVLKVIQSYTGGSRSAKSDSKIMDALDCAVLLLKAGTTEIDAPKSVVAGACKTQDIWESQSVLTYLLSTGSTLYDAEMKQKYRDVVGCLKRAGVDLDARVGSEIVPLVIYALRCSNLNVACELIRQGCNTSDDFLLRPENSKGGVIKSILNEADGAGGEYFETYIVKAMMERQIHVTTKDSIKTPGPIVHRRRMSV